MIYITHDNYRNAELPLEGNASWPFHWPGSCLTAQSIVFPLIMMANSSIIQARWRLTWNPNIDSGEAQTAVRIVSAYDGPSNIQEVASFYQKNWTNPRNDAKWVTTELRSLFAQAVIDQKDLQIILQVVGNGTFGPHIYSSALEVVYA